MQVKNRKTIKMKGSDLLDILKKHGLVHNGASLIVLYTPKAVKDTQAKDRDLIIAVEESDDNKSKQRK